MTTEKLQPHRLKCLLKLERGTGHCSTHSWVATLASLTPRPVKKSSHCDWTTYGPTLKPWGHARVWRKPHRDQKEVWPGQWSGNCLAHQGRTSQQQEQSKTHLHYFWFRSHDLGILTLIGLLETQNFIPKDHHKPLFWCCVCDPKGVEGLRNSDSKIFKELWRYAREACLNGSILLGNNLFLDTCRGPAPKIDVIQCLVVVCSGNVGKRNFPKASSCFSSPFPFFLEFCKTCDFHWLTSWWSSKFRHAFPRVLLMSLTWLGFDPINYTTNYQ